MRRLFFSTLFLLHIFTIASAKDNSQDRIISLGSTLTEELYLLGVEDRVVGVTTYCTRPARAQKKEKVGAVVEVDMEKIISLRPDLVLSTSLTNLKAKEKLEKLGIRVINFPAPSNFFQLCEQFLGLARLVNREKEAEEIIHQAKSDVDLIKGKVKGLNKPKVFIQIGAKPLFAANKDYVIHDFIEFAGGINIAGSAKSGLYSRERVIKDNPDIIIIATMGILGKKEKETWLKFKTLKAAQENRIYIVDAYKLCSPTPVTFVESLKDMVKILHSK